MKIAAEQLFRMKITIAAVAIASILPVDAACQTIAQTVWYNIYDGEANGIDIPNAATLDRAGNLYITGRSSGLGSGQDYLTVKYSPDGQELLVLRLNSPANRWDEATAIAVDDSGSIHVSGLSAYGSSDWTAITIKYDRDGVVDWIRSFPPDSAFSAAARSIQLDGLGNVYVAGEPDLSVVKYSPSGTLLWTRAFRRDTSQVNTLVGCVVTPSGDVYVTGMCSEECPEGICRFDMVTLKYDTDGNEQWIRYYTLDSQSDEQPATIALDSEENVVIAGFGQGEQQFTIKYSPSGEELWAQYYAGPSWYSYPVGIAVDHENNIIVAGTTWGQKFDFYAVKYSPTGTQLWLTAYDHDSGTRDFCGGVAVDNEGSVFLTGGSRVGILGNSTNVTVKLSPAGDFVWTSTFNRPDTGTDYGKWVFLDTAANVYVAGDGAGPANGWDFVAIKKEQVAVGVGEQKEMPTEFSLHPNYPNPFNPSTTLSFDTQHSAFVILKVFDILGREVATLVNERKEPGTHRVEFNAEGLPSGVYIYRIQAGGYVASRKMILAK